MFSPAQVGPEPKRERGFLWRLMAKEKKSGFYYQSRQLVRKILKQYNVIPSWVGGVDITLREVISLISLFTYVGVALGVWQTNPGFHHYFLNNFFVFIFSVVPALLFIGLLYYKFAVYAKQRYLQHQVFKIERSPMARKLLEHDEIFKEICKLQGIDYKETIKRVGKK